MPARVARAAASYRANRKPTRQEKLADRGLKQIKRQALPRFLVGVRMVGQTLQPVRTSPLDDASRIHFRCTQRAQLGRWDGIGDKGAKFANRQVGV